MNKKIYIFIGHPNGDRTLSKHLAEAYKKGAEEAGHDVRLTHIAELSFDPILHKGYKEIQVLEPDLTKVQEDMKWADHIVFFYPLWWLGMPALFKGMFDRMFLPGFAFNFNKNGTWKKLLKGKSARIVITSNTPSLLIRLLFGSYYNDLKQGILGFSGISPIKVVTYGSVEKVSEKRIEKWRREVYRLGKKAK